MNSPLHLSDLHLEDILPHRDGMLLIDGIIEVDDIHAVTRCIVNRSWPLCTGDNVHPLVLVELSAQTAGVCNGLDRIRKQGIDSEKMGWLVGVKRAEFKVDSLEVGSTLIVRAENTHNFENLREVYCEQHLDGRCVGTATLQLFQA